ncbi:MAG: Peptidase B, partial [uncultured Lysobacter sp.]
EPAHRLYRYRHRCAAAARHRPHRLSAMACVAGRADRRVAGRARLRCERGPGAGIAGRGRWRGQRGDRRRRCARSIFLCARALGAATAHVAGRIDPGRGRARRAAARMGPGQLPLQPLQGAAARTGATGDRRRRERGVRRAGRMHPRARPGQHADRAHGPGPAGTGGVRDGRTLRRAHRSDRRRGPAHAELSCDPCGRPRFAPRAAPDRIALGRCGASAYRAGRQGRVLRHGRAEHQARRRHAQHEKGHGRRRACNRTCRTDHGARPAGAFHAADRGGGKRDRPERAAPGRGDRYAPGRKRGDRQHRRRRPAGAVRCADLRGRAAAGTDPGLRHAHGRGAHRARPGPAGDVQQRRGARASVAGRGHPTARPAVAHAAVAAVPALFQQHDRRHRELRPFAHGRQHHRRAVSGAVYPADAALGASGRVQLERHRSPRPTDRRRGAGPARGLRDAAFAFRL